MIVFATNNPRENRCHKWSRKFLAEGSGQAASCNRANAGAHHLDGRDERPGDERGPENRSAALRPYDRVGANGRRVIIGRAGDQSRSQHGEETPQAIPR